MKSLNELNTTQSTLAMSFSPSKNIYLFREVQDSLDPTDDRFNFSLWAKAVKKQMVESLERRNKGKVGTKR